MEKKTTILQTDRQTELITIIAPVYNIEKRLLDRCIESVINQSYENIEALFIDDGSNRDTADLLDNWARRDHRLKVIHKPNGGAASARNVGLDEATGDYIIFLDSDDWLATDHVEFLYSNLKKSQCDIVQCGRFISYDDHEDILPVKKEILTGNDMLKSFLSPKVGVSGTVWGKIFPRALINNLRFRDNLYIWDDWIFERDLLFANPDIQILVLPDPKYHYYIRASSTVNTNINERKVRSYDVIAGEVPSICFSVPELREWHIHFVSNLVFGYLLAITKSGQMKEKYMYYVVELRKYLREIISNTHLTKKLKMAMIFACLMPHAFFGARCVQKRVQGRI